VLHVDLTVPLLVLASPLVVLGVLRMVASIADRRVLERANALVRDLERIPPGPSDATLTSRSRSSAPAKDENVSPLTGTNDSPQG
jgi:hypothetical protein